ncbi:MAG: transketolase [Neisseriales bacterium]|nr:MAG: transketolase [Neisseriales bacterium]
MVTRDDLANAIRFLSIDAVEKANSGHPGMPMGMADIAEVLWRLFLKHNPSNPQWCNRDRFILSNGHGSMLLYSLLHLTGYDVSIDDIKHFRQLHSKTPGHPEYRVTPGVETTTGPLGQGIANAVGMALAEKRLAAEFNRPNYPIVDHYTWVFAGDGCLMEGISHEVCSLAGTLELNKLVVFWDDNGISIDGPVVGWFNEDTAKRFEAYHWQVIRSVDGHDPLQINHAIKQAKKETKRPTLICCKTTIGYGSPNKAGSCYVHGAPLGQEEVNNTRLNLGWSYPPFVIPDEIYNMWDARQLGKKHENDWCVNFTEYDNIYPVLAKEFKRRITDQLPDYWLNDANEKLHQVCRDAQTLPTRKSSQHAITFLSEKLPELLGGSADLTESNLTKWKEAVVLNATQPSGNYIHYGVREFGMAAIINGIALHGGFKPFGGTFLMFSEYARNALRMAALMKINPIFVLTHDSIGLGEDGPTHQPIEQIATLRYIPNMVVWRPCDTLESMVAWIEALSQRDQPSCLIFSRQNLPFIDSLPERIQLIRQGGYILSDANQLQAVLIATGSEVQLALSAKIELANMGIAVRVVSMPSTTIFDQQDPIYRESVLPTHLPCVAIEAGHPDFWRKYVGLKGAVIGIGSFGESGKAPELFKEFALDVVHIVKAVRDII